MTARYMLDTDICSFLMRDEPTVVARLRTLRPSAVCLSAVSLGELRLGAELKGSQRLHRQIDRLASAVITEAFDAAAADELGRIGSALLRHGTPIGHYDVLIAAHAISLGVTLVTNNLKHFGRVRGLRHESWL